MKFHHLSMYYISNLYYTNDHNHNVGYEKLTTILFNYKHD